MKVFNHASPGAFARAATFAALASSAMAAPALAGDPSGTWLRDSGASRVKFAKCGQALCGHIVWLKDTKGLAKVGQKVFYDMVPNGENAWKGQAFNPEDGKTYSGKMSLSGASLTTAGCALGGLICKSVKWSKVN